MKNLSMAVCGNGLWLVGKFNKDKRILELPRVFRFVKNGTEFELSALPMVPLFVNIGMGCMTYPIPEDQKSVIELWEKVTNSELIKKAQESNLKVATGSDKGDGI